MCQCCWESYGAPRLVTLRILRALRCISLAVAMADACMTRIRDTLYLIVQALLHLLGRR